MHVYDDLPAGPFVLITFVDHVSMAYKLGLRKGDVVVKLGEKAFPSFAEYIGIRDAVPEDDTLPLVLLRGEEEVELEIPRHPLGFSLRDLPPER